MACLDREPGETVPDVCFNCAGSRTAALRKAAPWGRMDGDQLAVEPASGIPGISVRARAHRQCPVAAHYPTLIGGLMPTTPVFASNLLA